MLARMFNETSTVLHQVWTILRTIGKSILLPSSLEVFPILSAPGLILSM